MHLQSFVWGQGTQNGALVCANPGEDKPSHQRAQCTTRPA